MEYIAVYEKAKTSVSLTKDTQMDEHLLKGANIYQSEGDEMTLIATPEDGFIGKRPVFPVVTTMSFRPSTELEQAARILLGEEV